MADGCIKSFPDVTGTSSENTSQDISSLFRSRNTAVGNCESQGSYMICDDSVRGINSINVIGTFLPCIWSRSRKFLNPRKQRREHIGIVVGHLVLKYRDKSFETHASIDVFCREGSERTVCLAVELD